MHSLPRVPPEILFFGETAREMYKTSVWICFVVAAVTHRARRGSSTIFRVLHPDI